MTKKKIQLGNSMLINTRNKVDGSFVEIDKEKFYKISNYQEMPDFLMSVVSDSDHFMFISSNGSLSAGRKNKNNALFPYYTDDKIHDYRDRTGSKTYILVSSANSSSLWEPFTIETERVYHIKRNLYKSIYGNKLIFEEINDDLGVAFRYGWYNSDKFGIIRKSSVENLREEPVEIDILDGVRNILPFGVDYAFQNEFSNLLDAYKKSELINDSTLGIFALSSIPVDRPEPSEALKATTVWSAGLDETKKILLSDLQVDKFIKGESVDNESDVRASRGAYYVNDNFVLNRDNSKAWLFALEINQDSSDVSNILKQLKSSANIQELVNNDIETGTRKLIEIVGKTDGLQISNEELCYARHFSNSLFNIMRGGIFTNNYSIELEDFKLFARQMNLQIYYKYKDWFSGLTTSIEYQDLIKLAEKTGDPDLLRICIEYFPITFSRRHGDPSRPWNYFSIENKNPDGSTKLHYEGNWRDIFQNWEALSLSYPEFIEGMVSKFVNASTADGYNPYRITREGIDWEQQDPNDPWAFIGYWGDHQIIYLLKFLEQSVSYNPGRLDEMLSQDIFVYANVPYEIKNFDEIAKNPKDTIKFNNELNDELLELSEKIGADGKILRDIDGKIVHANLTEKILATLLSKLSNFIPEAGIWLNTQRPEWNDANNALVGNGASMVTLYYIRRFLSFWKLQFSSSRHKTLVVSEEIAFQLTSIHSLFREYKDRLEDGFSDKDRWGLTASLGRVGTTYRESVYNKSFSGDKTELKVLDLIDFMQISLDFMDQSIGANKRDDNLYHAYNLISINDDSISIRYLYEMLEGQVAVLSSGYLSSEESLKVLNALKSSKLFRDDQYSYILYPDRELTRFIDKNRIPPNQVKESDLLKKLLAEKDTSILNKDSSENFHFNSAFRNAAVLGEALEQLDKAEYGALVQNEKELILNIFEEIFDHQSFTGRSGTFYGYEGLGSIYWHMVSKLLLATQECYFRSIDDNADSSTINNIKDHYYEIKAGIGLYKSPEIYGAFPTDAYSHTPAKSGVKQPGLTGQVKEDVISRFGELGIRISNGEITFAPSLLNIDEVLKQDETFNYFDLNGNENSIHLNAQQIGFTFCQIPVIYTFGKEEKILVTSASNTEEEFQGNTLSNEISSKIFTRGGEVRRIDYTIPNL